MSWYRRIDTRVWGDRKFRRLSPMKPSGQSLWLYILTGPHTTSVPGLWPFTQEEAAGRLKWNRVSFQDSYRELYENGMCEADFDAGIIWVPKAIKYNQPQSPKIVKSWFAHIDGLPECDLKIKGVLALGEALAVRKESFLISYREPFGDSYPVSDPIPGSGSGSGSGEPPVVPHGGTRKRARSNRPKTNSKEYTPDFLTIWEPYPNGTAKREAFDEWLKIQSQDGRHAGLPVPTVAVILQAIDWKMRSPGWAKDDYQYVEQLQRFLRRRRWEDEPDGDVRPRPIEQFEREVAE